ncbi:hypothetical protein RB595_005140 [Gaeumannomyces hyphopodioides]
MATPIFEPRPDCYRCRINSWLHDCAAADASTPPEPLKASHAMVPPDTPPTSSPSKRRRAELGQVDEMAPSDEMAPADGDPTPRAPPTRPVFDRPFPLLPGSSAPPPMPTSSHAHTTGQSGRVQSSGSGFSPKKRSTSPIRRALDMTTLAKPIMMVPLSSDPSQDLPPDMLELHQRIEDIMDNSREFVPSEACEAIHKSLKTARPWPPGRFFDSGVGRPAAEAELASLQKINKKSVACKREGASEGAWNTAVHYPLLELAADGSGVAPLPITTARIAPDWLSAGDPTSMLGPPPPAPGTASSSSAASASVVDRRSGVLAGGKMVDFALVLDEDDRTPLGSAILQTVRMRGASERSINQSAYGPLMLRPLGVGIGTKAGPGQTDGEVQLGLWTAAWFARMRTLVSGASAGGMSNAEMPAAVPVILVVDHNWTLSFVWDRGHQYDFVHDISIGDTKSLIGLYKLLAVLRLLIRWMDTDLRGFFDRLFGIN